MKYLIETVSIFRMRYAFDCETKPESFDSLVELADEFTQKHIAENITSVREVTDDELIKLFREDSYSATKEVVLRHVNKRD